MSKAPYVFPIIGGRKVEHLKENIKCLTVKLTQEEIKSIEDCKGFEPGFPHDFIGPDSNVTGQSSFILAGAGTIDWVTAPKSLNAADH